MKVLMLDNYDSFTYNLVHYLKENNVEVDVIRNDKIDLNNLTSYDKIMLSPGPGIPSEAGLLFDVIKKADELNIPLMGVCLGHQAIAEVFGGELENMDDVYHGLAHNMKVLQVDALFHMLPEEFKVGRYHSWQVKNNDKVKEAFNVIAVDDQDNIMAIRHKSKDIVGVQFHPESVLTEHGKEMIANWIKN